MAGGIKRKIGKKLLKKYMKSIEKYINSLREFYE